MNTSSLHTLWTWLTTTPRFFPSVAPVAVDGSGNSTAHRVENIGPYSLVQFAHQGDLIRQGIPEQETLIKAHRAGQMNAIELVKGAIRAGLVPAAALSDSGYLHAVETSFLLHYWLHNSEA